MDLISRISENFSESAHLKLQSMDVLAGPIAEAAERMVYCLRHDGKILACGNGGSAADSQHFSAELLNRFEMERPALAAIALTTDTSTLTSIAKMYKVGVDELQKANNIEDGRKLQAGQTIVIPSSPSPAPSGSPPTD